MNRRHLAATMAFFVATATVSAQDPSRPSPASKNRDASASAPTTAVDRKSAEYLIGPEDVLDILVWKSQELSRVVPVRPDGMVSLPLVNDIQAAGFSPTALRTEIVQRLSEFVPSPEVSVIVREVHSVKVAVMGAVKMPGRYEVKSPATVLELLAQAQGFTEFANRDRIIVLRQSGGTQTRIPFNYSKVASGNEQENFFVGPGDIIVVP